MNDLKAYANSFEESCNITIPADFIDTLKSACEDLEILEILKKHLVEVENKVMGDYLALLILRAGIEEIES